jgi:predicted NBD/HSP70 family sugar kinase
VKILVIDLGDTHVMALVTGEEEPRKLDSSPSLTPAQLVDDVKQLVRMRQSRSGTPASRCTGRSQRSLGWVGFDFHKYVGVPVKIVNDSAMQALGSYEGGRMFFLSLGTGLGSAMIVYGEVEPMELAHPPYKKGRTTKTHCPKAFASATARTRLWAVFASGRRRGQPAVALHRKTELRRSS